MKLHLCYLSYHPRKGECGVSLEVRLNYITILCNLIKVAAILLLAALIHHLLHIQKTLEYSFDLLHFFVFFEVTTDVFLARIWQDSCRKYFFCQVLARNVFSAKILQDLYFLSRSCKNCIYFQPGFTYN